MRLRFIASVVFVFLLLSSLEAWAGYWLAGKWFISSRFASVSLGTVKNWLDRGIVSGATQTAKVFIQRNGKWILLTLGLSQVIPEVQNLQAGSGFCYVPHYHHDIWTGWRSLGTLGVNSGGNNSANFYSFSSSPSSCYSGGRYIPSVEVRRWFGNRWDYWAHVPRPETYQIGGCSVTFTLRNVGSACPDNPNQAPDRSWENQRRRVPVRVFPNPSDFLRDDVISQDPSLSWLRDEYNRISGDGSIPIIPEDALSGVDLPSVDWSIPPEEAMDQAAERSSPEEREGEGSREGSRPREGEGEGSRSREGEGQVSVPGLDTKLDPVQRKPFPVELINQLVQNHPLLRILSSVSLDAAGGGSCVIGSEPFIIDMCGWQWVLNLMGSFLVPLAFLFGLGIGGRSEG